MSSFEEATEAFLESADWLTAEDEPAIMSLRAAAVELDAELGAPLLAQYRLFYTGLLKKAPQVSAEVDPLEDLLKR